MKLWERCGNIVTTLQTRSFTKMLYKVFQRCINVVLAIRFYLTGDMRKLYPFIQVLLERPCSELFFADASLWNQYHSIAFNIFSCRVLNVSNEMLINTGISNEKKKKQMN